MTTPPNHNTADQSGADERAKFEAWSRSMDLILDGNYYNSYGGAHYVYSDFTTDTAFRAFRAALQSNQDPQPFPAPAVQSGDLDIAVNVFKSLFFNDGIEGESLDEQLRRAMRAAFISSGQAIAQTAPAVAGEADIYKQRYEFIKTMPKEMLLFWRGAYGCDDGALDAAMNNPDHVATMSATAPSQGAKQNG